MRKKRLYTRRQAALRRLVLTVIVAICVNHVCMTGFLIPWQVRRLQQERYGIQNAEVIEKLYGKDWSAEWMYLMAGEDAMLLSRMDWFPLLGWNSNGSNVLDCSGEAPFHVDWSQVGDGAKEIIFFGRAEKEDFREIEFLLELPENAEIQGSPAWTGRLTADQFIEKGGKRYFLVRMDWPHKVWAGKCTMTATAYDGSGMVVEELELNRW